MKKIWIRLGGFVSANAETMEKILSGDPDALIGAIKENGFEINGDTYIPEDEAKDTYEVEFDLPATELTVSDNQ